MDENLSWKEGIKYSKNKIANILGLLCKAKHYLNKRSVLVLCYCFIHTYINYGNKPGKASIKQTLKNQQSTRTSYLHLTM